MQVVTADSAFQYRSNFLASIIVSYLSESMEANESGEEEANTEHCHLDFIFGRSSASLCACVKFIIYLLNLIITKGALLSPSSSFSAFCVAKIKKNNNNKIKIVNQIHKLFN